MLIFFPPRLIESDDSIADSNKRLDDAVLKYTSQGMAILCEESSVKDALKIIAMAEQYDDIVRPMGEKR